MPDTVSILLQPLGRRLAVPVDTPLPDVLFPLGVEFPCGGRGRCRGCRVRVLAGQLPPTPADQRWFGPERIAQGWRLACQARAAGDLTLELAQWETPILGDDTPLVFTPRAGLGAAVDVGTTTLVVQLLDLHTGHVLGVRSALNAQARHGADLMSRLEFALTADGRAALTQLIREQVGALLAELLAGAPVGAALTDVVLVGNTVMHHLFGGLPVTSLAQHPFEPADPGLLECHGADLGWDFAPAARVSFLPCAGGFVGSDLLAGILATGLHERDTPGLLVDLGTNGEIVVGHRARLLCASTAAGPAFEGARIQMGMRAATGAISAVHLRQGHWQVTVLGGGPPRGLCGSGLVDAVACGLDSGRILPSGRLAAGPLVLAGEVTLTQADVRELQLAKGAIAAGIELLLARGGWQPADLERAWLAGAFGNSLGRTSARRIGLLSFPLERIEPVGNTALRGAKRVLLGAAGDNRTLAGLRARLEHVPLKEDPRFQEAFVTALGFPEKAPAT